MGKFIGRHYTLITLYRLRAVSCRKEGWEQGNMRPERKYFVGSPKIYLKYLYTPIKKMQCDTKIKVNNS